MKTNILGLISGAGLLSAMLGGFFSGGCGGVSVSSICEEICACQACTSNDRADCEKDGGEAEQQAADAGCSSEFDDFLSCVKDNITCKSGKATINGCSAELSAVDACAKGKQPTPLPNACDIAADHLATCLDVTSSGSEVGECTGQTICAAICINNASCDELKDAFNGSPTDKSKIFLDCVTACTGSSSSSSSSSGGSSTGSSSGG